MKYFLIGILMMMASQTYSQQKAKPRINHIAQYVDNLEKSTKFYQHIIGLDTIPNPFNDGRHTWFLIGPKTHLHIISGPDVPKDRNRNNHLCFSVESIPDFIKHLEANNISYEDWPGNKGKIHYRVDGVMQIYLQDPDGYWLEINDAKE